MTADATEAGSDPTSSELYRGLVFPEFRSRPYVAVNMVASVDGRAVIAGKAKSLGGSIDRLLMRRIRAAADCVLVGAATLRAEGYDARVGSEEVSERVGRGESPQPIAAVITATGDVPVRRGFFRVPGQRRLVLVSASARSRHRERLGALDELAEVVEVPGEGERLAVDDLLDVLLRRFAVRRLLVEGGPTLVGELFSARLVDELFLTVSPVVVGGEPRTAVATDATLVPPRSVRLVSAVEESGFLFLRYKVKPS